MKFRTLILALAAVVALFAGCAQPLPLSPVPATLPSPLPAISPTPGQSSTPPASLSPAITAAEAG